MQHDAQATVILFGSRARGDARTDSDWDLLILTRKKADFKLQSDLRSAVCGVELEYEQDVATIIMESNQWDDREVTAFYKNVAAEGIQV